MQISHFKMLYQMFFSVLLFTLASNVFAEQKEVFPGPDGSDYEVHYIALASTFLDEEVAKQYQLVRSRSLGLVNISVIKVDKDGRRQPVTASVQLAMSNELRQTQFLTIQQVIERPAIYYLAQLQYREGEILTFDATIYPAGGMEPLKLRFTQNFYHD
jgi:Domain of unknown function (DUF4426)